MRERFDLEALDPDDPFELDDGNIPHLAKHAPFTADDALDAWTFGPAALLPRSRRWPGGLADGGADPRSDRGRPTRAVA
jgi:hypothetical protein